MPAAASEYGTNTETASKSRPAKRLNGLTVEQAAQALHQAGLRQNPIAFAEHMGFKPAAHHRLILTTLKALLDDELDVLLIAAPPGSAKSTYVTIVGTLWAMARDPRIDLLLLGATASLAERFSRRARNHMLEPKWSYAAKGNVTLADDSQAVADFSTSAGGSVRAFGTGANILGNRADLAIIDDAVTSYEQAMSETQLEKVAEWLKSDVLSRLKPTGKIVAIQQRMAYSDAFGFLDRHFAASPSTRVRRIVLRMEAEDDDPLGREPGEPLWSEWYTPEFVERQKLDTLRWSTMWQQRPVVGLDEWAPATALIIDERPPPEHTCAMYGVSDFATGSGKVGDYTVHAALAVTMDRDGRRHIHVVDLFRRRVDPREGVDAMLHIAMKWKVHHWLIDDDLFAKTLNSFISERMARASYRFRVERISMGGRDKESRAAGLRAMLLDGRVHALRAPWLPALQSEISSFPVAQGPGVDDQIDALGLLPRFISKTNVIAPIAPKLVTVHMPDGTPVDVPEDTAASIVVPWTNHQSRRL